MARMIPGALDAGTPSSAERKLFEMLKHDTATAEWVILHSLGLARRGNKPFGEVDFVVLVPKVGIACLEVKGGRIACRSGKWETTNRYEQTEALKRNPFMQARDAMFAVRDAVLDRAPSGFPSGLVFGYAVVMPDIEFGELSAEWEPWQAIDRRSLRRSLSAAILKVLTEQRNLLRQRPTNEPSAVTIRTISQLLRPDFEVVVSRRTTIEDTELELLRLTEEQFRALDLLADNDRSLFEGAAGTGKTMLALEYARRSAAAGHRTLLICFNRLLGDWFTRQVSESPGEENLTAGSYFRVLRNAILRSSIASEFLEQESSTEAEELYSHTYPVCGRLALEETAQPFDVAVIDEAQDLLRAGFLDVVDVWLKGGMAKGRWAIFGDFERQAIYRSTPEKMRAMLKQCASDYAKGRLTLNCRNTRNIGEETALLSGFASPPYRMGQVRGLPVNYRYYRSPVEQCGLLSEELRRLLGDGISPADIVILSRLRRSNSGLAGVDGGKSFRVADIVERSSGLSRIPIVRFATAQSFKGMESPVVILCDVQDMGDGEPRSLLYVAMSRARSQLIIFAQEGTRVDVAQCIRRKLSAEWSVEE